VTVGAKAANAREKARDLYAQEYLPAGAIAARLGVAERTVARWKQEDAAAGADWGDARRDAERTRRAQDAAAHDYLGDFLCFQRKVLAELKDSADMTAAEKTRAIASLSDSFSKTSNACAKAAPQTTRLAAALDVLQRLARFVGEAYPDAGPALAEAIEAFAADLAQECE
jgi:hypothetical protein